MANCSIKRTQHRLFRSKKKKISNHAGTTSLICSDCYLQGTNSEAKGILFILPFHHCHQSIKDIRMPHHHQKDPKTINTVARIGKLHVTSLTTKKIKWSRSEPNQRGMVRLVRGQTKAGRVGEPNSHDTPTPTTSCPERVFIFPML
jgi:hypothetical protein